MYRIQSIPRSFIPYASCRNSGVISSPTVRYYSETNEDTVHVPTENKGKQVSRVPPIIQGIQPTSRELSPNDTRDVLLQAQTFLKNQQDRSQLLRNKMQNVNQGAACRELHTATTNNVRYSDSLKQKDDVVCGTADTWDEDMACVLQGSCLPGSTKYCRTKSMFGKMDLKDIVQSANGLTTGVRQYSTASSSYVPTRKLHNRASGGRTYEAWDEDVAKITNGKQGPASVFHEIPNIDTATRQYYHTEPRSQFVEVTRKFGEAKRSIHTGEIVRESAKSGRTFETWDEDVALMLHNIPSKPVYGRPPKDIRPTSQSTTTMGFVPVSSSVMFLQTRHCHTSPGSDPTPGPGPKTSQRERLKQAIRDYGATVVVFHIGISLISLGGFYLAVSSGIDMQVLLTKIGLGQSIVESKMAAGASTFVMAYAVHKLFAPVRIGITLTSTPFIVRYLRRVGFLRQPISK